MRINITFKDFKSEENFLLLQNKYLRLDEREAPLENAYQNVVKTDFSIYYKTENSLTGEEDIIEKYFLKGFLLPKISNLAKEYINFFKNYIEHQLLFDKEKIKLYSEIQLKKFSEFKDIVVDSNYLIKELRLALMSQVQIVNEYLKDIHLLPNYTIDDKFKMNMIKTDIILLFTLLRQNNNIDSIKDSHLGFLLEKSFLYKSGEDYIPINNAGKVVNDLKHYNRGKEKAIKRLKQIFKNDEFYEIDFD